MLWCAFNSRLHSSTRRELAVAILALLSPCTIRIGIGNVAVVRKGDEITKRLRNTEIVDRFDKEGVEMIGDTKSTLQRQAPYERKWAQMRDGDLWGTSPIWASKEDHIA